MFPNVRYDIFALENKRSKSTYYLTDKRDYSEAAIRETLLNAVIHRDYSFSGSTLISMFNDRMEIVSLGGLVPGLEIEDIFEGISQSRNPRLASVFYGLNYVEAYGTGIRKIQSECEKVGVRAEFSASNAAFRTMLPIRNSFQINIRKETGMEARVLQYIQEHKTVSRKEIQQAFALKQTKCGLVLKTLENQGFIKKYGAGRNTVYQI